MALPTDLITAPPAGPTIEAWLANDELTEPTVSGWRIDDDGAAEWAMTRYATACATIEQLHAQKASWLTMVEDWFCKAIGAPTRTRDYFDVQLQDYAMRMREQSPRNKRGEPTQKSVALVTGVIATTGHAEKVVIDDAAVVLAWAQTTSVLVDVEPEHGVDCHEWEGADGVVKWRVSAHDAGLIKVTESVILAALRDHVHIVEHEIDARVCSTCASPDDTSIVEILGDRCWRCARCDETWPVETIRKVVDDYGEQVPGVAIEHAFVTARVNPASALEARS